MTNIPRLNIGWMGESWASPSRSSFYHANARLCGFLEYIIIIHSPFSLSALIHRFNQAHEQEHVGSEYGPENDTCCPNSG